MDGNNGNNGDNGDNGNNGNNGGNNGNNGNNGGNNGNNGGNNGNNGGNNGNNDNNGNGGDNGNNGGDQQPSSTRLNIPQSAPAGEIVFTKPLPTVTSYYKIAPSNTITFGWNFSYILATPTHLQVSAACSGGNTYPVGPTDGIIPGTATEVLWDIYSYQINNPATPLPPAVCNLMIADERGFGVGRRAGYLSPNQNLQFALYTPEEYTPLASGWTCTVCNSASTMATHPAAISLLVTMIICLLSGFHLLRTANNR